MSEQNRVYERVVKMDIPEIAAKMRVWVKSNDEFDTYRAKARQRAKFADIAHQVLRGHERDFMGEIARQISMHDDVAAVEVSDEFEGCIIYNDWP